jgi:hypothetical protein
LYVVFDAEFAENANCSYSYYGDVLAVIFFYHRDTVDTETRFLFAHRETAMGKKPEPSVKPSLLIGT